MRPNGPGKMGLTDPCPWAEKGKPISYKGPL